MSLKNPFDVNFESVQFDFKSATSSDIGSQSAMLTINSALGDEFVWNASVDVPWLSLSKNSGDTTIDNSMEISLDNSAANLAPGSYNANVILQHPTDSEIRRIVSVELIKQ